MLNRIGVNYGRLGDNLPSSYQSIELIHSMKAGQVKLYDANPEILKLLSGTDLHVSIMVPNHDIISIASNQSIANEWIHTNLLQYYPETKIRFILVGNEVLSGDPDIWPHLVPAMQRIKNSLKILNIRNIKISTPLAMDILETTFPPSNATFRFEIESVILPLLHFLNGTKSYFSIDVYPYFPWSVNPTNIDLDFALMRGNHSQTDPNSGLVYTNLLDQMLDSLHFAMAKLGHQTIRIMITETGWPHAGDFDQPGANIYNAATYNRNLIQKFTADPPVGTPARPNALVPTFIFSLLDENRKSGPGTERNWGLVSSDGKPVYEIDLSGKKGVTEYGPLPAARNNRPYKGKLWCVVGRGANSSELEQAISLVCNQGNGTCDALMPGKECYGPISPTWHGSYAFSSYWAKFRSEGVNCYFNGLAQQTTRNPSRGSCQFPSVTL
ncbi:probable glucan endo-1,3-beta-glucosidase A6 [Tripterygium wilfordii]|uniref:probable glucan endo-1,3-beta-glucosidase A6 n=1 Tax=Tripterygium wilfordii TaxID=458696 RepID=UPI0018F859D7|nr:probable glucan endo-1,3-beta-glucosidase A6 [Tripterygium wilfordii]